MSQTFINNIGSSIILIASSIIYGKILLDCNEEKINIKKIILIVATIITYSLVLNYFTGFAKTMLLCIVYTILFMGLFKVECYKGIILTFMYTILTIMPDTLSVLFIIGILKVEPQIFYESYTSTIWSALIVNILFITIVYVLRKWLRKAVNIKLNNNIELLVYFILTLISIVIVFYNGFYGIEVISKSVIVSGAIMLVFVIILYKLIKQKLDNNNLLDKYDKLLEFIKKYEKEIDTEKMLRHETKNQLITIRDRIITRNLNELDTYIDSIILEHVAFNEEKYSKFQYLPPNGLKGLFYYKSMEAESKNIKLSINISKEVEKSSLSNLSVDEFKQLGRLVGIYLDNAIDASKVSTKKQMGIEIYMKNKDIEFIFTNTFDGEIDIENIGTNKYTTKGKGHGYGLMLAKRILNNYSCFSATKSVRNGLYIQKLIVKNKELKIQNKKRKNN